MTGRIIGLETEYGINLDGGELGPEQVARELFQPVVEWGRSTSVFTSSGGRLYLDVGSHPEFATPECACLSDLVAQDVAGQRIMAGLAQAATARLAASGQAGRVHLIKNNADSAGSSFGCHENYCVPRAKAAQCAELLIPFLVSRQILVGAGHVRVDPVGARLTLSARSDHVFEATSSATTRARPMINTRDEPHADGSIWRRLHVIVGDSSICQATTWLKVGSTDLVLRAIEQGLASGHLELDQPVQALRQIAHGYLDQPAVALRAGGTVTAPQLQQAYFELAEKVADSEADLALLDLWRRVLEGWQSGDFTAVAGEIDWVIKDRLIRRYQERTGASLLDPRVARLDLAYHDIGTEGLAGRLEASGGMTQVVASQRAAAAVLAPPAGTRAQVRGAFVDAARAAGQDYVADWTNLKLAGPGGGQAVTVLDPYGQDAEPAWALVEQLGLQARAGQVLALDGIMAQQAQTTERTD